MRTVTITDSTVIPAALVVAASTKVVWHNHGHNRHTVTADDGTFGSAPLFTGDRFTINAPARPGVYGYHCIFHSYIRGTLTVSPVSLAHPAGGRGPHGRPARDRAPRRRRLAGERPAPRSRAWVAVADTTAGASGAFSATSPALTTQTVFRALAAGSVSPSVRVLVRPVVAVTRHGARLTVRVRPAVSGAAVHLERLDRARAPLGAGCERASVRRTGRFHPEVAWGLPRGGRCTRRPVRARLEGHRIPVEKLPKLRSLPPTIPGLGTPAMGRAEPRSPSCSLRTIGRRCCRGC